MNKLSKFIIFSLLAVDIWLFIVVLIHGGTVAVLNPKGIIAMREHDLIITAILLMLLVVLPTVILTFFIAWKYRASNTNATYTPNLQYSGKLACLWWAISTIIVIILAVITWKSTHALDPYKPLESKVKPITIQVVALRWKWLFIYPDHHIATVNFIQFPERTPINFELTADAPMNSFWIPELGGQMYAMTGMKTHLHLMADVQGEFAGSSAEISGRGFSGMRFVARSSSQADFDTWVQSVRKSSNMLDLAEYTKLVEPSENNPVTFYAATEENLYNKIIMKFMAPSVEKSEMHMMNE